MLKIRLQRIGRRNNPSYRIVVVESTAAAKKGKPVELLGTYDTIRKTTVLNKERVQHWMTQGAKPSDTMHNILIKNGVIEGVKKNVLPKKNPVVKSEENETEEGEKKEESATEETQVEEAQQKDEGTKDTESDEKKENPPQETPSEEG